MLINKLQDQINFTNQEKVVADFILNNINTIPSLSAQELANESYTSKGTVVRLSQKLGYTGFQEFKLHLIAELHENQRLDSLLFNEPITSKTRQEDVQDIVLQIYDKSLTNTRLTLGSKQLPKIIRYMKDADEIIFLSTGVSYIHAQLAAFKFSNLGLQATSMDQLNLHYLKLNKDRKILFFLISFTGKNETVFQMAKYLRKESFGPIVGFVGPYYDKLKPYCDEIIEMPNRESLIGLDVVNTGISLNYLIDILFSMYLAKTYDQQVKANIENLIK